MYHMLYLILLLPFLLGIACAFCKEENARRLTPVLAAAQTVLTALVIYAAVSGRDWATSVVYLTDSLTFSLKLDGVAAVFAVVTAVCWLLTIPYAAVYMPHSGSEPRFYVFLFTTEAVLLGTALAADMVTLYLFYELTTLCSAPLVLHELKKKAIVGAYKYLFYSVGGAFVALFGVVVLYFHCESLSFTAGGTMTEATPLTLAAVFCMILGFGAKAGLFPLHNWLPSAHPAAPAPASALLSGLIAKAGVIAVLRTIFFVAGADLLRGTWVQTACLILVMISIFMGSFMGCLEKELKKRLAYSSISQISYVLLGLFILSPDGFTGSMLQLFFHAAAKIAIFQCAGSIILLAHKTRVDELRGLGRRMPVTFLCFTLVSLSLVGIPPFGGFHSKWYLATAALDALPGALGYLVPVTLILSALFTAGYLFPPVISAFFPGHDTEGLDLSPIREPAGIVVPLVIFAAVCGLMGLFPNGVLSVMESIAGAIA